MNVEALLSYIEQPGLLHKISYQELKTMVVQYPYCQNLRHLLLIKSHQVDSPDFERNLQLAATYSLNRELLYRQMKDQAFKYAFTEAPQGVAIEESIMLLPDLPAEIPLPPLETLQHVQAAEVPQYVSARDLPTSLEDEDELDLTALETLENLIEGVPNIRTEVTPSDLEPEPEATSAVAEIPLEITNTNRIEVQTAITDDAAEPTEVPATPVPQQAVSFTDWLARFRSANPGNKSDNDDLYDDDDDVVIEQASRITDFEDEYEDYDDDRVEFRQIEDIVQRSISDNVNHASETLADLLVMQGQYQKAIDIYELLCLKFPEKSTFFAQKIALLKEEKA